MAKIFSKNWRLLFSGTQWQQISKKCTVKSSECEWSWNLTVIAFMVFYCFRIIGQMKYRCRNCFWPCIVVLTIAFFQCQNMINRYNWCEGMAVFVLILSTIWHWEVGCVGFICGWLQSCFQKEEKSLFLWWLYTHCPAYSQLFYWLLFWHTVSY